MHISFIYLYLYTNYVVLFAWLFPYEGPEMCQVFHQVSFLMICHYVAVLPPANRCIDDCSLKHQYICSFQGARECAVILDNLIQIF